MSVDSAENWNVMQGSTLRCSAETGLTKLMQL